MVATTGWIRTTGDNQAVDDSEPAPANREAHQGRYQGPLKRRRQHRRNDKDDHKP